MRITDVISEEQCLSWKQNDYVMITAPTGSGKTHFILKRLLPLAIQNNRRILYLCNRLLVLEQTRVAAEADGIQFEEWDGCFVSRYFSITTYQKIEHKRSFELEKTEHF